VLSFLAWPSATPLLVSRAYRSICIKGRARLVEHRLRRTSVMQFVRRLSRASEGGTLSIRNPKSGVHFWRSCTVRGISVECKRRFRNTSRRIRARRYSLFCDRLIREFGTRNTTSHERYRYCHCAIGRTVEAPPRRIPGCTFRERRRGCISST